MDGEIWPSSAFCFHSELVNGVVGHMLLHLAKIKQRCVVFPPAVHALASQGSAEERGGEMPGSLKEAWVVLRAPCSQRYPEGVQSSSSALDSKE